MIGCIKAISPCVKRASAKLFPDLHTVSAPSGEERTLDTSAQVERAGRCCRRFNSGTHAWCGRATVMVLVSSASGPRVSGCIRAPLNFRPYPVFALLMPHMHTIVEDHKTTRAVTCRVSSAGRQLCLNTLVSFPENSHHVEEQVGH
jgi:hypothetical protein